MEWTFAKVFWVNLLTLITQSEAGIPLSLRCSSRPSFSTFSSSPAPPCLAAESHLSFLPKFIIPVTPDCSTEDTTKPAIKTVVILHKMHKNDDTDVEIVITKGKKGAKDCKTISDKRDDDETSINNTINYNNIDQTTITDNKAVNDVPTPTNGEKEETKLQNNDNRKTVTTEVSKQTNDDSIVANKNGNDEASMDNTINKHNIDQTTTTENKAINEVSPSTNGEKEETKLKNNDDRKTEITEIRTRTNDDNIVANKNGNDEASTENTINKQNIDQTTTTENKAINEVSTSTNGEKEETKLKKNDDRKTEITEVRTQTNDVNIVAKKNDNNEPSLKKEITYETITNRYEVSNGVQSSGGETDGNLQNNGNTNVVITNVRTETMGGKETADQYNNNVMTYKLVRNDAVPSVEVSTVPATDNGIVAEGTIKEDEDDEDESDEDK